MSRTMFRLGTTASHKLSVKPKGGKFGAGLIAGVSICTEGEALGHDLYLDGVFLQQVAQAVNAKGNGIKSRWGHPSILQDGIGTVVGRVMNARLSGSQVRADVHLLEAAKKSPKGDLVSYLLGLADEDPEALGMSIVFEGTEADERGPDGQRLARLEKLWACDFVDEAAANPGGLFDVPAFSSRPTGATRSSSRPAAAPPVPESFMTRAYRLTKYKSIPLATAFSTVAAESPQLYADHLENSRRVAELAAEKRQLESERDGLIRRLANRKNRRTR